MGSCQNSDVDRESFSPFEIDNLKNNKAPDFLLKDINGKSFKLSSFKGKVVLLNFWSTKCPPCKSEMPSFNRLYKEMKSHGLEIITVSTDKSIHDVIDYIKKKSFDFQILWDEDLVVTKLYKVFALPTTFLIDRNMIIVEKFMGDYQWTDKEIKNMVERL